MTDIIVKFEELQLDAKLLRALQTLRYETPTPIQVQAIPPLLLGRDVLGCAQTGTGKTAAFALPLLHHLLRQERPAPGQRLRVLVLAPTRELALQIDESFGQYGQFTGLKSTVIFGGVGQGPQVDALRRGVDILVATPGRLLDLQGQGLLNLNSVRYLVLDEADRMLDMGFVRDVRRIVTMLPKRGQTLLFSATMAPEIRMLASELLQKPVEVAVTPAATTVELIEQAVMHVAKSQKRAVLERLLADPAVTRCVVFTRTKHGADKVAQGLEKAGIKSAAIHGNRSQNQRVRALEGFKGGDVRVLVATDIAARGLDIDGVSHVINFELPNEPDSYVHRIGRTARNGASGVAWALCDPDERPLLRDIERRIQQAVPVVLPAAMGIVLADLPSLPMETREPFERRGQQNRRSHESPRGQQKPQASREPARTQAPQGEPRRDNAPRHDNAQRPNHAQPQARPEQRRQHGQQNGPQNPQPQQNQRGPAPRMAAAPSSSPSQRVERDWY